MCDTVKSLQNHLKTDVFTILIFITEKNLEP